MKDLDLPKLTESSIRGRASGQSWERGQNYFRRGCVYDPIWRDGTLTAEVQGSAYAPYVVQVIFDEDSIRFASCTCPYDWGGDCKHIIATLLYLVHTPEAIERRPPLTELLADLSREELIELIVRIAEDTPQATDDIEQRILTLKSHPIETPASSTSTRPEIDGNLLRRQIKAELRASLNTESEWGHDWYDADLAAALEPAYERARAYLEVGDAHSALELLKIATEAWDEGINSLDPYVRDGFVDIAGEFTYELGEVWAEAVLSAELQPDERAHWQEVLEAFGTSVFGGDSLNIAVTAAEQGWDYPPLVAAMEGDITEKGAWEDEAPYFADDLARIRLDILDRRGQYEAYLNLAQAEGQFMRYLHMLVRQGQSDKAVGEAVEYLIYPSDLHAMCKTLMKEEETEKAFKLAQHGLDLEEERGKAALAAWLRDQARTHERPKLELQAAQQALAANASLENYLALQEVAGDAWEDLKDDALETVAHSQSAEDKVNVYLHEHMYRQAIEIVEQAGWYHDINYVIEAVKDEFPDWAFNQCRQRAESIMNAGRSKDYALAVDWLRKGRDILLAADQQATWEDYLSAVKDKHERKYKLMPMLQKL